MRPVAPAIASTGKAPDELALKKLGDSMAAENGYTSEASYQLYDTSGSTEDWSYWITGGFGGLGIETARWLARSGALTLVLTGRNPPGADALAAIQDAAEQEQLLGAALAVLEHRP